MKCTFDVDGAALFIGKDIDCFCGDTVDIVDGIYCGDVVIDDILDTLRVVAVFVPLLFTVFDIFVIGSFWLILNG